MEKGVAPASGRLPVLPELDGIRAVALAIVFLSHIGTLGKLIPGGLGVTIFFFLSGYLITSLLRTEAAQCGRIDYPRFYARRTLRIFPPLYMMLALSGLAVATGMVPRDLDPRQVWAQLLFLENYSHAFDWREGLPGALPLWSLAVEEHFYLLFPWFFGAVLMRMPAARAGKVCLTLCVVPLLLRLIQAHQGDETLNYYFTHTRIDSLLFGCALALWHNPVLDAGHAWRPGLPYAVLGGAMILGAALVRDPIFTETFRYSIQGIGLWIVFSWVLGRGKVARRLLSFAPLQIVGRYSYTLYLVHLLIIIILKARFPGMAAWQIALACAAVAMAYAAVSYALIERPLARLRHRLHSDPAPDLDVNASEASAGQAAFGTS